MFFLANMINNNNNNNDHNDNNDNNINTTSIINSNIIIKDSDNGSNNKKMV